MGIHTPHILKKKIVTYRKLIYILYLLKYLKL